MSGGSSERGSSEGGSELLGEIGMSSGAGQQGGEASLGGRSGAGQQGGEASFEVVVSEASSSGTHASAEENEASCSSAHANASGEAGASGAVAGTRGVGKKKKARRAQNRSTQGVRLHEARRSSGSSGGDDG